MGYDADIQRIGARALFDLKGAQADLANWAGDSLPPFPTRPNTMTTSEGCQLAHIGRDHWILLTDLAQEVVLEAALKPTTAPVEISIVKISDTQCFFAITGADADQIISIACPLDIHTSVFPENGATFSTAFGLKALIIRQPAGYWLAVEQSFGDLAQDYFSRALT